MDWNERLTGGVSDEIWVAYVCPGEFSVQELKVAWGSRTSSTEKSWGSLESWTTLIGGVQGQLLRMRAGATTACKYYLNKVETFYILQGSINATIGDEMTPMDRINHPFTEITVQAGGCLSVPSGCPYKIQATEDTTIFEISNTLANSHVLCPVVLPVEDDK